MACGCGGGSPVDPGYTNDQLVAARFTGTRIGSRMFEAGGLRYAFGQNQTHRVVAMPTEHWIVFKNKFGNMLLETPMSMLARPMALHSLIATTSIIGTQEKELLVAGGLETVGQIIASREQELAAILGDLSAQAAHDVNVFFGLN